MPNDPPVITSRTNTDWHKCIICQDVKFSFGRQEKLICPNDNLDKSIAGLGYESFSNSLQCFHSIAQNLKHSFFSNLFDNKVDIPSLLSQQNACWHKSCYLRFNQTVGRIGSLMQAFHGYGNPLQNKVLTSCTWPIEVRTVYSDSVENTVRTIEELGQKQLKLSLQNMSKSDSYKGK